MTHQPTPADVIAFMNKIRADFERMTAQLLEPTPSQTDEGVIRAEERLKVAEEIASAILAVDPVEWALAGQRAGEDAARIARQIGARRG